MEQEAARREVAYVARRLYAMRLTTTSGGNVSCRLDDGGFAITPSGTDKARIRAADVVLLALDGSSRTAGARPSSEFLMHLRIYARCRAVHAVVHAHPPCASAFACADTPIRRDLLAETYALLDEPVTAPYALTTTDELADTVAACAARSSCILMRSHGVTTTGATLLQAFDRMELLEAAASITLMAARLEGARALTPDQRGQIDLLVGRPPAGR